MQEEPPSYGQNKTNPLIITLTWGGQDNASFGSTNRCTAESELRYET